MQLFPLPKSTLEERNTSKPDAPLKRKSFSSAITSCIRINDQRILATLLGAVSGERVVLLKLNTVRSTVVRQTQTNSTLDLPNGIRRLKAVDKLMVRNAWDT